MNHIYRLVWNHLTHAWVCCAENAKGRGKSGSGRKSRVTGRVAGHATALAAGALASSLALAAPTGGQVSAGAGSIAQSGNTTTINQTSQHLAINWQGFDIAANESVRFNQPNAASVALNRVTGQNPSQILGSLSANGQVFVLNPNGVLFGAGAQVNVGGLVASTLGLSDADLMASRYIFNSSQRSVDGAVVNQGTLNAAQGGYIALLAPEVRNEGVITATQGTALLAAGKQVTVNLNNGSLLGYHIDQGALKALADNQQLIQADGGTVILSAKAADALASAVVNNTGIIEARTLNKVGGVIKLMGDMAVGTVHVGGTLDASAPAFAASAAPTEGSTPVGAATSANGGTAQGTANGGFIETSAAHVKIADSAKITTKAANGLTGSWLIDPVDFTIAATGGDMTAATLTSNLASSNVLIQSTSGANGTSGNVNVNDTVSWSTNKLTLNAQNNIHINANLNASGTASLALEYGQGAVAAGNTSNYFLNNGAQVNLPAGQNFSTKLGSDGVITNYTVITALGAEGSTTATDLQGMNGNLAGKYVLGANVDASATFDWNLSAPSTLYLPFNAGFTPIGSNSTPFTGSFDGLGHTITGININRLATDYVGLFGYTSSASAIRNVGLLAGWQRSIKGNSSVGALAGLNGGSISNSYTEEPAEGISFVGGLVGYNTGSISNSHSLTGVGSRYSTAGINVGGLVGYNTGSISNSYATGNVVGTMNWTTRSGTSNVGGLVGLNEGGISNSYANGAVTDGYNSFGGLVGANLGSISNSYATGMVTWNGIYGGGLVGSNNGNISTSYATGVVGTAYSYQPGGLVGGNSGTVSNSFWDSTTSGRATSAGGFGMTTANMQTQANFTSATATNGNVNPNWDFTNTWVMYDGHTAPLLRSFMTTLTVTVNNATKTYDGLGYSGGNGVTYSVTPNGNLLGTVSYGGAAQNATNAGSYTLTASGLYSNQQGYIINYTDGTLDIAKKNVAVTGLTASSKVYDAGLTATLGGTAALVSSDIISGDTLNLGGTPVGAFADKNVGTAKPITVTGHTLSGTDAGNYNLVQQTGLTADITKKDVAVTGLTASNKTYDADTVATLGGTASVTALSGDNLSVGGTASGAFANKNVGTAKPITVTGNTLSGTDAGNYNLVQQTGLTADITKKDVAVTGLTASNKTYDAGTVATLGGTASVTALSGDNLSVGGTASGAFANKNVGTGKAITVTGNTLGGTDAGNYNLVQQTGLTADITKANLAVTGLTTSNKTYDGSTTATVTGTAAITALVGDSVSVSGTAVGAFADKNVGTGKAVSITGLSLSGADAGNYTVGQQTGLTANITQLASVTWTGGSSGNWSNAANWAGGAIPDQSNVAAVVIPAGVTVTYDGGVAGTTRLNSLSINSANTFNVSGGELAVLGGSTSVNAFNLSGGGVYMFGALTAGTFNQTGGTWYQQIASLPSFSATDFRVTGGTFHRVTGGDGSSATPYQLIDIYGVQGMGSTGMLGKAYALANDIDATGTTNWNAGAGFVPIGNPSATFTGSFDGQNHTIGNLSINRPAAEGVGLFGVTGTTSVISHIGLIGSSVTGSSSVGTLVGQNGGSVSNAYATGSVTGAGNVGTLVGYNSGGSISNAYATGSVSGNYSVGGLVGYSWGSISNAYASTSVTGSSTVGGLLGSNAGTVTNSYWDTTTSGQSTSAGGTGLTTAQMQQQSNFTGLDFTNTWVMYNGHTDPLLRSFMTPLTVSNASKTYDGQAVGVSAFGLPASNIFGTLSYGGTAVGAVNAGSYTVTGLSGLYSNQQGYIISYADGALTVNQLASVSWTGGSTGNWSDSANWAGGATPDHANVAAVVIPTGVNVTYDSGVSGTTTLSSLTSSGKLTVAAGTLATTGNLSTAGFQQTGGTVNVGGNMDIHTSSAIIMGNTHVSGNLVASSTGADISQTAGSSMSVGGTSSLIANNGQSSGNRRYGIVLNGTGNDFVGAVSVSSGKVKLVDSSGGLILDNLDVIGTANLISLGGDISQSAGSSMSVSDTTTLTAADMLVAGGQRYNVVLGNSGNNFVGAVSADANQVTLVDGTGGLILGKIGGNVIQGTSGSIGQASITSLGGDISQTAASIINVTGSSNLVANNRLAQRYNITLANAGNDFGGAVSANAANLNLRDRNALSVALDSTGSSTLRAAGALQLAGSVGGTLNVTNSGATSLSGALSVNGATTTSANGSVTVNGTAGVVIQ